MNEEETKVTKPFVKSITEFQKRLTLYEKTLTYSIIANIIMAIILLILSLSNPLVIMEGEAEKLSFTASRQDVTITENEIKKVVENFIRRRFEWEQFSIDQVIGNLSPLISSGLKQKIAEELLKEEKTFSYNTFSQYVGRINITIDSENNIVGSFDKILRINRKIDSSGLDSMSLEKIPLLSEAQVMVKVIRGLVTKDNPLGLYINSVINYEPR